MIAYSNAVELNLIILCSDNQNKRYYYVNSSKVEKKDKYAIN